MSWVKKRADCTIENIFDALIKQINSDVDYFNRIKPEQRNDRSFILKTIEGSYALYKAKEHDFGNGKKKYTVDPDHSHTGISIKIFENLIVAEKFSSDRLSKTEIRKHWNDETLNCDFCIADKSYSIHQISQKIIGNFLFEGI